MRPAGFCILIRPDPAKDALKNDKIVIPDSVLDRQRLEVNSGIIVDVGSQAWKGLGDGQPWAAVGDHVIYAKHGGKLVTNPETNEELVLMNDKDIIGLLS